jgi:hypothetical protein
MALNINGTTGISGVDASVSAPALTGTDSNTGISFPSADTIKFSTAGVERMSITNSGISGITQGLTEVDSWRITSTLSNYGDNFITANWERTDTYFEKIGTGLTESSGVFSFPSTGKYLLMYNGQATGNGDNYIGIKSYLTVNNGSSYISINENYGSAYTGGANTYASFGLMDIVDVTDISNYKWKYMASSSGTVNYHGLTSQSRNGFTVYKLGET